MPPTPVIAVELMFSYGRGLDFPHFALWGLAAAEILIVAEYVRRSLSNR